MRVTQPAMADWFLTCRRWAAYQWIQGDLPVFAGPPPPDPSIPSSFQDAQSQVLLHGIKVPVRMQQFVIVPNAVRTDEDLDRLAHRDSTLTKPAIVVGGEERAFPTDEIGAGKFHKEFAGGSVLRVSGESLQQFRQNEITCQQPTRSE